jgi:hypothetical protein
VCSRANERWQVRSALRKPNHAGWDDGQCEEGPLRRLTPFAMLPLRLAAGRSARVDRPSSVGSGRPCALFSSLSHYFEHSNFLLRFCSPMGGARVVAAGRNAAALEALVKAAGPRVAAVQLTGDVAADAGKLREACCGGAEIAFDMVGRAGDANATLAALKSLRRGGRLVLMGSMTTPLTLSYGEIMRNNWEIIGQFMYPAGAYRSLLGLIRAELLDLSPIRALRFPLAALPAAMDAAGRDWPSRMRP